MRNQKEINDGKQVSWIMQCLVHNNHDEQLTLYETHVACLKDD